MLYPSEFIEGIRKWYIVGEDHWYMVGEDCWFMVAANSWYIMDEDYWYIVARGVTTGNHWVEIEVYGASRTKIMISPEFEWDAASGVMTKYYFADGQAVAMRVGSGSGTNGLQWLLSDHLGSTSITANGSSGAKLSELRYKPWGELRYAWSATATDRRYTGQRQEGIGLYDYNARFYEVQLGRFAQADTIIPEQYASLSWDRYAAMANNPVRYTDPTGHKYDPGGDTWGEAPDKDKYKDAGKEKQVPFDDSLGGNKTNDHENQQKLSHAQKIGMVVTTIITEVALVIPTEAALLAFPSVLGFPAGVVVEVVELPFEVGVLDFALSLAIQTYNSVESGYKEEFRWTIMPIIASEFLPEPVQEDLHQLLPRVFP